MTEGSIGFIGLGHMGEGMARRLVNVAGKKLVVWNRSEAKSKALEVEAKGSVTVSASPAAVVRACAVTYVMLSEPRAVATVYEMDEGILAGVSSGKKIVDCATLAVADMERLAAQVAAMGGRFLEAPVSGSKAPAAQGQLIFLAAGDEALYKERAADFDAMGKAKFFVGAVGRAPRSHARVRAARHAANARCARGWQVGGGTRVKLAVNMVMGTMLASLGEGLSLTIAAGIAPKLLLEVLELGAMACPLFKLKGPKMLAADYAPAFPLKHAEKDVKLAVAMGRQYGLGLPVASTADGAMLAAMAKGLGDSDFAATCALPRRVLRHHRHAARSSSMCTHRVHAPPGACAAATRRKRARLSRRVASACGACWRSAWAAHCSAR